MESARNNKTSDIAHTARDIVLPPAIGAGAGWLASRNAVVARVAALRLKHAAAKQGANLSYQDALRYVRASLHPERRGILQNGQRFILNPATFRQISARLRTVRGASAGLATFFGTAAIETFLTLRQKRKDETELKAIKSRMESLKQDQAAQLEQGRQLDQKLDELARTAQQNGLATRVWRAITGR